MVSELTSEKLEDKAKRLWLLWEEVGFGAQDLDELMSILPALIEAAEEREKAERDSRVLRRLEREGLPEHFDVSTTALKEWIAEARKAENAVAEEPDEA
jgi:hypothetical protein